MTPADRRRFRFVFEVTTPATEEPVSLWIPKPLSDAHQHRLSEALPDFPSETGTDPKNGNEMVRFALPPSKLGHQLEVAFEVERRLWRSPPPAADRYREPPEQDPSLALHLAENKKVPLTGITADQALSFGAKGDPPALLGRRAFDYLLDTFSYDSAGCTPDRADQLGNLAVACDIKTGTCTEFHGLFVAYMRTLGVPARFTFGFNLPRSAPTGRIRGYHCWAEMLLPDGRWFPVDVSEAWKKRNSAEVRNPEEELFYFGSLDADRVAFVRGRDLTLAPPQAAPPLDKFIFPYAESRGVPVDLTLGFRCD